MIADRIQPPETVIEDVTDPGQGLEIADREIGEDPGKDFSEGPSQVGGEDHVLLVVPVEKFAFQNRPESDQIQNDDCQKRGEYPLFFPDHFLFPECTIS